MRRIFLFTLFTGIFLSAAFAKEVSISGPDGQLKVVVSDTDGLPKYRVSYKKHIILEPSPLGLFTDIGDFREHLYIEKADTSRISEDYQLNRSKTSEVHYEANQLRIAWVLREKNEDATSPVCLEILFRVSNNDIAFQYHFPTNNRRSCAVVKAEATGFDFPEKTTTFLCPQSDPMIGWMRSKPSYEEEYRADEPIGTPSKYGQGYTFPCLFHIGECWALVSETGVSSEYCGSHLSDATADGLYTIAYPMEGENNGFGSTGAQIAIPSSSPWRTITVGDNLKPIVETTVPFDVVKPLYEASTDYVFGRATWHWMIWDDASCNEKDIQKFIDLAAELGYEYTLIDGLWDKQIGYENMPSLFHYAREKGVQTFLWYNSNGAWNDAPQGPRHKMANSITRKQEMKWMQANGVKGIKVDFWAGDKQETMRLYEQVLSDANDYGLMVIFHGCTLPRGWERMYPNYVGSEAVLASENLKFNQHFDDMEAFNACLHPFIRNTVACMEFGGSILNKQLSRDNQHGTTRRTGDAFELATAVLFQNPIQLFGLTPNNLHDAPAAAIDFMKSIPTTWDETRFIDGYPGKYIVLARRSGETWYCAAINAMSEALEITIQAPFGKDSVLQEYADTNDLTSRAKETKMSKKGIKASIPCNGGVVWVGR